MDQNEFHKADQESVQTEQTGINETLSMPMQVATPDNRRRNGIIAACVIVALLLLGGLYFVLGSKDTAKETTTLDTDTSETTDSAFTGNEMLIRDLKEHLQGDLQQVDSTTEHGGTGRADGVVFVTAAYQSGNQEFAVYPLAPYGFGTISTAEIAKSDQTTIVSHLKEHGFNEVTAGTGIYSTEDSVCAVTLFMKEKNGFDGVSVGCADDSSYESSYQAILPFFTAYKKSESTTTESLVFSSPKINEGVDGYKNAYISIGSSATDSVGGFAGLFYFVPDTNEWVYFTGTQSDVMCDMFTTDALKRAFSGQQCIDPATNQATTVKAE